MDCLSTVLYSPTRFCDSPPQLGAIDICLIVTYMYIESASQQSGVNEQQAVYRLDTLNVIRVTCVSRDVTHKKKTCGPIVVLVVVVCVEERIMCVLRFLSCVSEAARSPCRFKCVTTSTVRHLVSRDRSTLTSHFSCLALTFLYCFVSFDGILLLLLLFK